MEIIHKEILHGPNYWTKDYSNILVCRIDANGQDDYSADDLDSIPGEMLKQGIILPEDVPHHQAEKIAVYFSSLITELQKKTGVKKPFSFIASTDKKNEFTIGISYEWEEVAEYSVESSFRIIQQLISGKTPDIDMVTKELNEIYLNSSLGATTSYLVNEAEAMGIPWKRFGKSSLIIFGHGIFQRKLRTAVIDTTSALGLEIAGDKNEAKLFLKEAMFPVPDGLIINGREELQEAIKKIGYPLVIKPLDGNHGRGVTTNIRNEEEAEFGFEMAVKVSQPVVVERFISGDDYRFLVIDYKLAAVARRTPAKITGDGSSAIQELIEKENLNPQRGSSHLHVLAPIIVDATTEKILRSKNYSLSTVLKMEEELILKDTANISAGGTSTDVTHLIHPENIFMAERIARIFNLNICGIDVIAKDISLPVMKMNNGVIIEVNAGPGLRMHSDPTFGTGRNIANTVLRMLFPQNRWTIPIIAIAESGVSHQIAHLLNAIGFLNGAFTGCATREGVFFQEHRVYERNGMDFEHHQSMLFDPTVSLAILECSVDSVLRKGLGFNKCDVCILPSRGTGADDLFFTELIMDTCLPGGYCIINCDDPDLIPLAFKVRSTAVFYSPSGSDLSTRSFPPASLLVSCDSEYIAIYRAETQTVIHKIHIPHKTRELKPDVYVPVLVTACLMNFDEEKIRKAFG